MLQISGFVSGLVVVAYLHSYQFSLTFYILCLGCLPKMKEKNISSCITAADKIFCVSPANSRAHQYVVKCRPVFTFVLEDIQLTLKADSFDRFLSFHDN